MKRVSRLALNLALLLCCAGISQAHNGKTAYAIPIADITIDGKLDDWPEEMAVYPIDWVHPTAYKPSAPDGPQDLTASFCAGFSLEANLLFLAIVVEDDYLVVHPEAPHFTNQDLSDLYVDADHSGGDIASQGVAGGEGAQQYLMVAGPSMFYLRADGNPSVAKGSTRASGVKAAFLRVGSTTVYEWSVPLFENFPDSRLQIELGQTIGFDAAVVDADGQESGDWVAWTAEGSKITDSDLYGDLVFVQDYQGLEVALGTVAPVDYGDLGTIAGIVTHIQDGTPWAGVEIEIQAEDGKPAGKAITDAEGRYQVWLLSDNYRVSLDRIERGRSASVTLQPGMQVEHIDFAPALGLITGKVTQPNRSPMGGITVGAPMGGITVRAEDRAGAIRAEQTTTGANGSYRIWLEPGTYLLAVENPEGAEPVEVIARAGEEMGNVDFALVGATIPTWPFTTALAILGVGVLACLMPLVRRRGRLGGILLSPDRVFQEVTGQPDWVGPFFLILVSVLVGSIAMTSKLLTEMGGTLGGMPGAVGMMMIGMPLFVLAAMLVGGYAGWFIRAGSIWIIARLSGERTGFYPLLSVVGYAFLPELLLGGIVMACVVSFGEISISSMSSLTASTSLAGVLPALAGSTPMRALLGEIELFAIWSVVLTTVGVRRVYGVSIRKAGMVVILYWLLGVGAIVGFAAITDFIQQMMAGV